MDLWENSFAASVSGMYITNKLVTNFYINFFFTISRLPVLNSSGTQLYFTIALQLKELGAHAKFQNTTINPSGKKLTSGQSGEKKKERKKKHNAINTGHIAMSAQRCSVQHLLLSKEQILHEKNVTLVFKIDAFLFVLFFWRTGQNAL